MLLKQKTLVGELISERNKFDVKIDLLKEVQLVLEQNELERKEIGLKLKEKSSTKTNNFNFDLHEKYCLFPVNQS